MTIVALAGMVSGCGAPAPTGPCAASLSAAANASPPVGIEVGQTAPPICGTTLDGTPLDLASLRGRPVLLNFWASWCGPCRDEFPLFKTFSAAHPDLVVVGVVYQDTPAKAKDFATSFGATWSSVTDPDGSMAKSYRIVGAPQSYFIDRAGVMSTRQIGILTGPDLERQYAKIGS